MESPSSSSRNGSDDQMIRTDLESSNFRAGQERRPRLLSRARMAPVALMKGFRAADLFKIIACLTGGLCIFQYIWIQRLQAGYTRIPNDRFDIRFTEDIDRNSPSIWDSDRQSFIHNALPVPVHSHNDYEQRIPLFEALGSGCISVEADIHLRDSDLLVGHTSANLHSNSTLRSMYLEPLQRMIEVQNADVTDGSWRGIFNQDPHQTVILVIDHKTAGPETFAVLDAQLQNLRDLDFLTYWNGAERIDRPLAVVVTGNAPFDSVLSLNDTHRDIFWDAPLDMLRSIHDNFDGETPIYGYNRSNSYLASTEFRRARLFPAENNEFRPPPTTPAEEDRDAVQIDQAKARGLIARYWDTPQSPPNLRDIAWRVLVEKQVGLLNMDDLGAVRARANGWGKVGL
ncbi:Altered inheritance of mitochondria protein 6 [Arachnomyces sp. PD_36]|nr:Altered inheritance of mitochondria protein 6 [Arachnomyces sp. PD_36]